MAGPYLFVSPSLTPCPAVCLPPLFHLCYNLSIHSPSSTHTPSRFLPPSHFLAFSSPTPVCLPFPFVLLVSFNLPPPALSSFSFFFWLALLPFLFSAFPSLLIPFLSHSDLFLRFSPPAPFPQLSPCCLFLLPQVSDVHTISLCFRRPHPAPHSRLLLMIKAKTSHQ